ncbi:MAG: hypothetical protein CR974_03195 [Gammaproteobacteria bacterium]|nr:MAG: hypothetical protein CR974_03195 [Gammaproteobacteria bacterium]
MTLDTLQAIRHRRTIKAMSHTPLPATPVDKAFIETLIESAYWAPFHYTAHANHKQALTAELPFRFYVLDSATCREVAKRLQDSGVKAGKLQSMLHTADYLIQATWTPQPHDGAQLFEPSLANMEHIAAAGAAIQNLLLAATALGRENYWGSGGVLRDEFAFEWLDIPKAEVLLGALFIFPDADSDMEGVEFKTSPKRDKRGALGTCYRWVTL